MTLFLFSLGACSKHQSEKKFPKELTGKWKYSQYFYSPGGGLIFTPTENLHQWIDFKADGSFSSNLPEFQQATSYEVLDSVKVRLINPSAQTSPRYFYRFDSNAQTLTMSSADYICIEGCGWKFRRE